MKRQNKFNVVVITLIVILGLTIASCGEKEKSGPAFLGEELNFSSQVYVESINYQNMTISYTRFEGDLAIDDWGFGGTGEIEDGIFSYSIGTPDGLDNLENSEWLLELIDENSIFYEEINVAGNNVNSAALWGFNVTGSSDFSFLSRKRIVVNVSGNSASETYEIVFYIYVDDDATISGRGKTETFEDETYIGQNFNLELKAGWNAIFMRDFISATFEPENVTITKTISLSNPSSVRWVLED
jgi:hypothetical protein